jgi:hypothetical protein
MATKLTDEQKTQWANARKAFGAAQIEMRKQQSLMQAKLCELQQACEAGPDDWPLDADQPGPDGKKAGEWVTGGIRPMPGQR